MKKIFFQIITLLFVMIISSCSKDEAVTNNVDDDCVTVRFCVSGLNITQEKTTRANTIQDAFPMLDLVLYTINNDGSYTKYKECSQTNTSSSYGVVTFENVKCGTYKLVAIGHNDSTHPSMEDPENIAFSKYVYLYGYTADVTITKTSTSIDVPFVHKSAKIDFEFNGYIPDEVEKIQFSIDGASNVYNAITGLAASTTNRVAAINVSKAERDAKKVTTYTYTLLTQNEINSANSYVNITIAGLNASNQEIDPKTYNHIPLKIGYTTKLAGVFFDYNNLSFNMTVNKDWGSYETVEL